MNFLVCRHMSSIQLPLTRYIPLENISEDEAISKALDIAKQIDVDEPAIVILFTEDAKPIRGWQINKGSLRELGYKEVEEHIRNHLNITPQSYADAKKEVEKLLKAKR